MEDRGGNLWSRTRSPVEVQAMFHLFLYLKDRDVPYPVVGMFWFYSSGGTFNYTYQCTSISTEQFEDLLSRTNLSLSLTRTARAKKLARKWIKETGYVKLIG